MTNRYNYRSFEEIDARLEELKLSRDIAREELILDFNRLRTGWIPKIGLLGRAAVLFRGNTLKNIALAFATKRVLAVLKKGRRLLPPAR